MRTLGFGIIGCGTVAPTHAKALAGLPGVRVIAVADVDEGRARALASQFEVPNVFTDYRAMLDLAEIDAVSICTPHYLHAPMAIDAARAGKHALVEKPLAITPDDAGRAIAECRAAGVILGAVFQHRFNRSSQAVRRAIDAGRLGRLLMGSSHTKWYRREEYYREQPWRGSITQSGGAALINQAIHMVDLLRWFMGPVEIVAATQATMSHEMEAEDMLSASVRFASGAVGTIEASVSSKPDTPEHVDLYGTRGSVVIGGTRIERWDVDGETLEEAQRDDPANPLFLGKPYYGDSHPRLIEDFVESIRNGRSPYVTAESARETVALVAAAYESARTGRFVRVQA